MAARPATAGSTVLVARRARSLRAIPVTSAGPEHAADGWKDRCPNHLTETTFDDFHDGTMPRSLGNLYVSADGAVRVVRSGDLNEDGFLDLVFTNRYDGESYALDSWVYWGSADGFSELNRTDLPTVGAGGCSVADLDADGFLDLVFSNESDGDSWAIGSFVYWGSAAGFTELRRTVLPTLGATTSSVADLDADGFLDIVFSNLFDGASRVIDSWVYLGSAAGFSESDRVSLPTLGARGSSVADLDGDGFLDIVFSNEFDDVIRALDSYVYWGSAAGFSELDRADLPTLGAWDNSVADLDGDGFLEVVFSNYMDATGRPVESYVYWSAAGSFSETNRTELPTLGATENSVADLDGEGHLDLVFSNWGDPENNNVDSYVYWWSPAGFSELDRTELPTVGAHGNSVADFDGDGSLDLVFSNEVDGSWTPVLYSYLYWGSATGFSTGDRTGIPTVGATAGTSADLGNVYDRRPEEEYISSVLDLGAGAGASPTAIEWAADTPLGSSVRFQLRSAPVSTGLSSAPWLGPGGADGGGDPDTWYERPFMRVSAAHAGHRWLQYRAVFRTPGFLGRPALHSVTIHSDGG